MSFTSLTDVINAIHQSQSPQTLANSLKAFVKRDVGETILASIGPDGQDPLTFLLPNVHTVGALYLLSARLNIPNPTVPIEYITSFCANFEPAVARFAPERVTVLAKGIAHLAELNHNPRLALGPLKTLIQRYPPTPGHFTTIHCVYLRACVRSDCWSQALSVLSVPLTDLDKSISEVAYLDNLTYYYLGGIIYAVLKLWKEAEEFFEICVSAPGNIASAIQIEASKKLSLIQLIQYGKTKNLPKYVSLHVSRQVKQPTYQAFIKNYPGSTAGLTTILEKEMTTFSTDGNVGLIRQAIRIAPRWIVRKLTDTYLTLSLEDIAKATGNDVKMATTPAAIEEATLLILGMIEREEIYATLTPSPTNLGAAIVTFRDPPPPKYFDPATLERVVLAAQAQSSQLGILDKELGMNRTYLSKAVREKESQMHLEDMDQLAEYERVTATGAWE